jgi:predicted esterase
MSEQAKRIIEIIEKEAETLGSTKKVSLCGFSEGASLALTAWIKFGKPLGGVFCANGVFCS